LADLNTLPGGVYRGRPSWMATGVAYFQAKTDEGNFHPGEERCTASGTSLVSSVVSESEVSRGTTLVNGMHAVFRGSDGVVGGYEALESEGTAAGTMSVKEPCPGAPQLISPIN